MERVLDLGEFWDLLKDRAVVIANVPAGPAHDLAVRVNESEGRGDASIRTRAEATALFGLLHDELDPIRAPDVLTLTDGGQPTAVANAIDEYRAASIDKHGFFDRSMYMV